MRSNWVFSYGAEASAAKAKAGTASAANETADHSHALACREALRAFGLHRHGRPVVEENHQLIDQGGPQPELHGLVERVDVTLDGHRAHALDRADRDAVEAGMNKSYFKQRKVSLY